jgi:UDP-glucose 4-epimerase
MKRVLITGVAGLIGSHLADKMLDAHYHVTGVDNMLAGRMDNIKLALRSKAFTFKKLDISDKVAIRKKLGGLRFDIIVHLAASKKIGESGSSLKVLTNNLESTVNMLELAKKHKAKFIFASTSDVYGVSKDLPFREDGNVVLGPSYIKRWSYAVSKLYCEHMVFAYHHDFGLPVVVLRYFGCFSSRSNYGPSGGHVPMFIKKALDGDVITIHGDGSQTRSMTHVADVVNGTFLAIKNDKAIGNIINIGSNEEISVRGSADIIMDTARRLSPKTKRSKIEYVPMKKVFGDYKEIARRIPSLAKAKELLGYKPKMDFKKAVKIVALEMSR